MYVLYLMPRCILEHSFICFRNFSETDIKNMLNVLIDNIFAIFGGSVFQQTVGINMDTNYAPLLPYLFLFLVWGSHHIGVLKKNVEKLAWSFNFTFSYIDDVRSLNNSRFGDFIDRLYPIGLELKDTTDTDRSASYFDLHLKIDNKGRLRTDTLRQKRWFQFSHCELSIYM